jgi:hypothetical protein
MVAAALASNGKSTELDASERGKSIARPI